jgi:hypothetical protein
VKFLRNLMKSLLRKLQAIIDGQGDYTKYQLEELYTQWVLFQDQNLCISKERLYPKYT